MIFRAVESFTNMRAEARLTGLYSIFISVFLLLPIVMAVAISFSESPRIQVPPEGFSWRWYRAAMTNQQFIDGFWVSSGIALATAAVSSFVGTTAALSLNHFRFRGHSFLQVLIGLPLALPAIVVGLGLLFLLPTYGMRPGFASAVFAHSVIGSSYVAYLVLATFANYDMALERASLNLGASKFQTLRFITLPIIQPGIVAGAAFAFLVSFDNVSLSLFVTRGETLPLRLMQHIQFLADPTVAAVSMLLIGLSLVFLVLFVRVLSQQQLRELRKK